MTDAVVDDTANHRLLLGHDNHVAELVYRLAGTRLMLIHTGVPDALAGQGIGGRLVQAAVDRARRDGLSLVPYCPFAAKWLRDHRDAATGVDIVWPTEDFDHG